MGAISITLAPRSDYSPRLLVQYSRPGSYRIQIAATRTHWCQYAFQFSHEYCHLIIDPYQGEGWPNQWLIEAMCEMASVFALRRMAEGWTTDPPHPQWKSYSSALADYAQERLTNPEHALPSGVRLNEWLTLHHESLLRDPYQREKNAVIAYQLLPIFESHPSGWNAVRELPTRRQPSEMNGSIGDYLRLWRSTVDPDGRSVVDQISQMLTAR